MRDRRPRPLNTCPHCRPAPALVSDDISLGAKPSQQHSGGNHRPVSLQDAQSPFVIGEGARPRVRRAGLCPRHSSEQTLALVQTTEESTTGTALRPVVCAPDLRQREDVERWRQAGVGHECCRQRWKVLWAVGMWQCPGATATEHYKPGGLKQRTPTRSLTVQPRIKVEAGPCCLL